jgi:hypothetical protein
VVQKVIEGTFTVIILAWVLTHATEFGQVATSIGGAYTTAVNALKPSNA